MALSLHSSPSNKLPLAAEIFSSDPAERDRLRRLLLMHPAISVTHTPETLAEVNWPASRLLFCDLDRDAERVLHRLSERPTSLDVILFASEKNWAAAAFETDAIDFLVKPIIKERLGRSIRRLLRLDWSAGPVPPAGSKRVFVPFERGRRMIAIDDICAIHAVGNYTRVLLAGGATEIVLRPLRRWEETLDPSAFLRIHRSTLVNASRIRKVAMVANGDGALADVEGLSEPLAVSRRCLGAVRSALGAVRPYPDNHSSDVRR